MKLSKYFHYIEMNNKYRRCPKIKVTIFKLMG